MEVTKLNFKAYLPSVKAAIDDADFIAIDTELTGLNSEKGRQHAFDTLEGRYQKLKQGCEKFLIIQFGLSAFRFDANKKKYIHQDFNFYVFPRRFSSDASDTFFLCQASSIDFLVQNEFDFNKLFQEGIPYLNAPEERKMAEMLKKKHDEQSESLMPSKNEDQKPKDERTNTLSEDQKNFLKDVQNQVDALMESETAKSIDLPACNSYLRKLIYNTVYNKYPTGVDLSSNVNENEAYITVVKVTEEERRDLLLKQQIADREELSEAVGFRKVLDMLTDSKKHVIGHNMLLDMMHTVKQFYHPLPESLDNFKELLKLKFPNIIDTKTVASLPPLKECFIKTSLDNLFAQLEDAHALPSYGPADGFRGYELSQNKLHEAGYDAFITGLCFIGLMKKLAVYKKIKDGYISPDSHHLSPFVNRLFIMMLNDIMCMNLNESDDEPDRGHVFYVLFRPEWKMGDLFDLFNPFGQVYVSFVNDCSAFVALKSPGFKHLVMKDLVPNARRHMCTIIPYYEYMEREKMCRTLPASESQLLSTLQTDPALADKRSCIGSAKQGRQSIDPIPEEEEEEEIEKEEEEEKEKEEEQEKEKEEEQEKEKEEEQEKEKEEEKEKEKEEEKELSHSRKSSKKSRHNRRKSRKSRKGVPDDSSEPDAKRKKTCTKEPPSKSGQHKKIFPEPDSW